MIRNLSQLKKQINEGTSFEIIDHCRKECVGQIRKPNVIQSNGFYSIIPNEPDSRESKGSNGNGSWLEYGKASYWTFDNGICSVYLSGEHSQESFIMSFKLIEKE